FDTWLDNLQLYLLSDSRDSVLMFDHTSGASLAPPAKADSATRSQWQFRLAHWHVFTSPRSLRNSLSRGTTALVTPPCHAFMACTPASLSLVFPGLCLPSRPRLPRPAFHASRAQPPKGEVPDVLIPWIRAIRLQLRERFGQDLPVLRLHFDRGGEFSSDLLWDFCHGEGILQSFMLPASPQPNGIAEHRIGLVMEVARTSMIHCGPDVTFDELVPFYHLFHYRSAPLPPPPLFLAPGPPPVDPLPPQGPAPSGVSQINPLPSTMPVEVTIDSGAARGAASGGAAFGGAEPAGTERGGAESEGGGSGGAEPGGAEPAGAESEGAEPGGAEP
ncbi:unnamed protein product, partial [Closterium sp. NIES-53]